MTTYELTPKEYRRFYRRMRASTFSRKCGADMGIYGHFTGPIATPKLSALIERIRLEWAITEKKEKM